MATTCCALQDKGAAPSIQRVELRLCVVEPAGAGISPEDQIDVVVHGRFWTHAELRAGRTLQNECPEAGHWMRRGTSRELSELANGGGGGR